jgi:cobalamin biosynthesis protein CobT
LKVNTPITTIEIDVINNIESIIEPFKTNVEHKNLLNQDRESRNRYVKNLFKQFLQQPVSNVQERKALPNYNDRCVFVYTFIIIAITIGTYAGLKTWKTNQQHYEKVSDENELVTNEDDEEVNEQSEEGIDKKDEEVNDKDEESIDSGDEEVNNESEEGIVNDNKDENTSDLLDFLEEEGQVAIPAHMFLHNNPTQPQYL